MSPMKFLQVTYSKSTPNQGIKVNRMNGQIEGFLFLTSWGLEFPKIGRWYCLLLFLYCPDVKS